MSVDLGHEFFKVALMRQGAPLEIVLNPHSKRKTATAVSFLEAVRAFGDDAMPHAGKAPSKVPTFFHSQLAHNYSNQDIQPGGLWWKNFALGDKFYAYDLGYDEDRGVPTFKFGPDLEFSSEEVLGNILFFAKSLAEVSADGKPVKDCVVTIPSNANMRYRQAIVAAGEVAGLRMLTLVHEGSAFAVQRAVDYAPEKDTKEYGLFYNMGSRKTEVTIVQMESRQAGMVAGKTAPVVNVLGSAIDMNVGGHLMDLKIAAEMLKQFQEKHKNLAEGVAKNPRALKKLVSQAQKTKAVLSANKQGLFAVESLFEDTDFMTQITRSEFERMCEDMFNRLTDPVKRALETANITLADINNIELVGGAWRVPKVQQVLANYFETETGKKVSMGQHLNGEEASALGAALVGANSSSSFRVKKIFFSDVSAHSYAVQVVSPAGEKNLTTLYPVGTALGSKKKLSFSLEEDFVIKLFEDGVLLSEYSIVGLEEVLKGRWASYNLTGAPKVNVAVHLEASGIIEIKTPTLSCEESYWVNETKKIPKQKNGTNETNATADSDEQKSNTTNSTKNKSKAEEFDIEVVQVKKKKKHDKKLTVTILEYKPKTLCGDSLKAAKSKLEEMAQKDHEVHLVNEMKNELEALIYGARDKMEGDALMKVSTSEQREEVVKMCGEIEEWSYEGSAEKNEYETRLQGLRALLGPMEERALELESREDLPATVKEQLDEIKQTKAMMKRNMSWVNESKIEKAQEVLMEFTDWWAQRQEKQKALPLSEAPAFTKIEVLDKLKTVQQEWEKLKKIKKPKEPVKKKDAKDEKEEKDAKSKDESLPDTVEATEKALSDMKKAKADAIENEDYDKAQDLKKHQELLTKHLAQLKEKAEL